MWERCNSIPGNDVTQSICLMTLPFTFRNYKKSKYKLLLLQTKQFSMAKNFRNNNKLFPKEVLARVFNVCSSSTKYERKTKNSDSLADLLHENCNSYLHLFLKYIILHSIVNFITEPFSS